MSELFATPGVGVLLAITFAVAIGAIVWTTLVRTAEANEFRTALRDLDNIYEFVELREQELLLPFADRVLEPFQKTLAALGGRFTPRGYLLEIRAKTLRTGNLDPAAPERFLAMKAAGVLAGPIIALFLFAAKPLGGGLLGLALPALALFVFVAGPDATLNRKVEEREGEIMKQLPDILDLLVICVEAGLGFNSALARTVRSVGRGELSDEFALALGEMKAGATRSDALGNLADRVQTPEVQSFVTAVRQADKFGVSIARTLREQAITIRKTRRNAAQEQAQKAPVKMLVPMVFFIFPPMFLIIIGPAGIQLTQSGGLG